MTNPTYTHSVISCGKQEREMLRYLNEFSNERFNVKGYSRRKAIPRSTIYDMIHRLQKFGFVVKDSGNTKITEQGKIYLSTVSGEGVGSVRRECRTSANLSTHYHKFKLKINKNESTELKLKALHPEEYKTNSLNNLFQTILKFNDATVIINNNAVLIHLYDVLTEDVAESDFLCFGRFLEYVKLIEKAGIYTEGAIVEEGHWARIESLLSDFLYHKVDEKYYLDLGGGRKFWIDHSNGKREDETNDKEYRERLDNLLTDMGNNNFLLSDIGKLAEMGNCLLKIEVLRQKQLLTSHVPQVEPVDNNKEIPRYIG